MNANSKDVPTVKLLIDGAFVESATNEWRDIVNPATQQVLARVPFATVAEVDAAVQAAHTAFATWKNTPIAARMRIMLKFQDLVRTNQQRIAKTLTAEQGKTIPDAEGDIFRGLKWSSTRARSVRCNSASSRRTSRAGWIPTRCASRSACARASRRSTSPR